MKAIAKAFFVLVCFYGIVQAQTPQVVSTVPTRNELDVSVSSNISATFSIDMNASTIGSSTFLVSGLSSGPIQGTVTYDVPSRTATFNPSSDFLAGEQINVILTSGIQSSGGVPLWGGHTWSFTATADNVFPGIFMADSTYSTGVSPFFIVTGDFDNDGDIDLCAANQMSDSISIHLNNGDGTYAPAYLYAVGDDPRSVFAADFDFDGDLDLAVANFASDNFWILLNNGNGVFSFQGSYGVGDGPHSICGGDFDGDGDIDLAIACTNSNYILVEFNNGGGVFGSPIPFSVVGTNPVSIAAGDIDNDGDIDIIAAIVNSNVVNEFLNNGSGIFSYYTYYAVGTFPRRVILNDFDGDGDLDVATANSGSDNVSVLKNYGNGIFATQAVYHSGHGPFSLVAADLGSDGDLDLIVTDAYEDSLAVLINNGNGIFTSTANLSAGDGPYDIVAADLDSDGDVDLANVNVASNDISIQLYVHCPKVISVVPSQNELDVSTSTSISLTFDRDMDESTIDNSSISVRGLYNCIYSGAVSYNPVSRTEIFDPVGEFRQGEVITVMVLSNVRSADGLPLIGGFTSSFTTATIGGPVIFDAQDTYSCGQSNSVISADLDNDGHLDLVVADYYNYSISVLLNHGNGIFPEKDDYPVPYGPDHVVAADFDNDGDLDLASSHLSDSISILMNNGDGTFASRMAYGLADQPRNITAADLDGDGDIDIATANAMANNISILRNEGDGTFGAPTNYPVTYSWSLIAADFDNDGLVDLAASNGADSVSVLYNVGNGVFSSNISFPAGDFPRELVNADMNGDTYQDIITSNLYSNDISVIINNGDGSFSAPVNYQAGPMPQEVRAADFDGDGDIDVAVANFSSNNVFIFANNGTGVLALQDSIPVGNGPSALFAADLDNDGDHDLVASNYNDATITVLFNALYPGVLITDPIQNELNIDPSCQITATFNMDMSDSTFTDSSFVVNASMSGLHPGVFSYDGTSRTAIFDPDEEFKIGEVVNVSLTEDIQSLDMRPLEHAYSWNFIIKATNGTDNFVYDSTYSADLFPAICYNADFNGDGNIDLAVPNRDADNISIMLNDGHGVFNDSVHFFAGDGPISVWAGDFDEDGDNDIAAANYVDGSIDIFLNDGFGTFVLNASYSIGNNPQQVVGADFNGDGNMDLGTTDSENAVMILPGNGDGTFGTPMSTIVSQQPVSLYPADLDGDYDIDLAVSHWSPGLISVLLNNGDGTFTIDNTFAIGTGGVRICAADLDNDGDNDLAVAVHYNSTVAVLMNRGFGDFSAPVEYAVGSGPYCVITSDADYDGYLDLVVSNAQSDNISVLRNNGNGTFAPQQVYGVGEFPHTVVSSDFNGDGTMDLATSNTESNDVTVLLNLAFPRIVSISPEQNSLNVPLSTDIDVVFSMGMDQSSFNDTTFLVRGSKSGYVTGVYSYNNATKTAIFNPDGNFQPGEIISVTLTTGVVSDDAYFLEKGATYSFTAEVTDGEGIFALDSTYGSSGNALYISVADLDNDLDQDIVVSTSVDMGVFLNNGDGSFAPQTSYFYGGDQEELYNCTADINRDGYIDIVMARRGSNADNDISIIMNNGDGTFTDYADYPILMPRGLVAADFNNDGWIDLATAAYRYNYNDSNNVSIFFNNGDSSFTRSGYYDVDFPPIAIEAADMDNDGDEDICVAISQNYITILFNNGNGIFDVGGTDYPVGSVPIGLTSADLNGDKYMDLISANSQTDDISVLLNDGEGSLANRTDYWVGDAYGVETSDIDNDGDLDLLVACQTSNYTSVLLNNGAGVFIQDTTYLTDNWIFTAKAADFNGDGSCDFVAGRRWGGVLVYFNAKTPHISAMDPVQNQIDVPDSSNISISFDLEMDPTTFNDSTIAVNSRSTGIHIGSFSYVDSTNTIIFDPTMDFEAGEVVTATITTGVKSADGVPIDNSYILSFTIGASEDSPGTFIADSTYAVADGPDHICAADFDNDGDIDLATASRASHLVSVLLNNGDGTFAPQQNYSVNYGSQSICAGDLNEDGYLDLITANIDNDDISVLMNNGDGTFAAQITYGAGDGPSDIVTSDFNGDGHLDLATANLFSHNVSILLNLGNGTFSPQTLYSVGEANSLFAADLDNDGDIDISTGNGLSRSISVLLNQGDGTFASQVSYPIGDNVRSIFGGDFDGDGDVDMVTANAWYDSVSVLINNGDGTFAGRANYAVGSYPVAVFAADLDGDGDLEIIAANTNSYNLSVLTNNGNGTFGQHTFYPSGDLSASLFAVDLDGDNDLDLATACTWPDNVWILMNTNLDGVIAGTVRDEISDPIESVYVEIRTTTFSLAGADEAHSVNIDNLAKKDKPEGGMILDVIDSLYTDENGYFEATVDTGTYDLFFSHEGFNDTLITGIAVTRGDSTVLPDIVLISSGCPYVVGDVNNNNSFNGLDVTYGVAYFKGGPPPPYSCECTPGYTWYVSGDVNASCSYNGLDITYAVAYFKGGPAPQPCPDCPPARFLAPPIPGERPIPAVQPILVPTQKIKPKAGSAE